MNGKAGALVLMCVMVLAVFIPLHASGDSYVIVKDQGGPHESQFSWSFMAHDYGLWKVSIANNGLKWLAIDVYDNTTGFPVQIMHQRIRFAAYDAYPTGTIYSDPATVARGRTYEVTVTPNGAKGTYAVVSEIPPPPPVIFAAFTATIDYMTVFVDGSASYSDVGIASWDWNWGDGTPHGSGMVASHTYAYPPGTYTITLNVTDNAYTTATTTKSITVSAPPGQTRSYKIYDMFQQPWGEWWTKRWAYYMTDIILTDWAGKNTMMYLNYGMSPPNTIIYAPYRMSTDAYNILGMSMKWPEFMPVFGNASGGVEHADLDMYFQYIDSAWWDSYWLPTWGSDMPIGWDDWDDRAASDGYDIGTVYTVTMNRDAAAHWLGMPLDADATTWWAANKDSYITSWNAWINYQGNREHDIWAAYEWPYTVHGTFMKLEEGATGDLTLKIGHLNWGFEVLITRWLSLWHINAHQPWYEDFSLSATFGPTTADVHTDGVCQYSLHAVKANQSTGNDCAWVWEPNGIDYIYTFGHPTPYYDYKPPMGYQSWNALDPYFGQKVNYENTPIWFNLSYNDSLSIQLPQGEVPWYPGSAPPPQLLPMLQVGDRSLLYSLMKNGTMEPGMLITKPPSNSIVPTYDPVTKTLVFTGPAYFDNYRHAPYGPLYHGAPWLEFDVIVTG